MHSIRPLIEFDPPDLSDYRQGNTGIEYVWSFTGAEPGPHVVLTALTHGNEISGAIALDHLLRAGVRPARGKLSFVFANIAAYHSFNRRDPITARYLDEDLNRLWDAAVLDSARDSRELARARALRPVFDSADLLLDLHSMINTSMPMSLTGIHTKHLDFARRMGFPALLVRDSGHAAGSRLREYGRFSDPAEPAIALLVECGQHWSQQTADVAIETAWRFLVVSGAIPAREAPSWLARKVLPQKTVLVTHRITATLDNFRFTENFQCLEVIPRAGTVIAREGGNQICTPYDNCLLIMPTPRPSEGQTAVRLGRFEE